MSNISIVVVLLLIVVVAAVVVVVVFLLIVVVVFSSCVQFPANRRTLTIAGPNPLRLVVKMVIKLGPQYSETIFNSAS